MENNLNSHLPRGSDWITFKREQVSKLCISQFATMFQVSPSPSSSTLCLLLLLY